jgi:rfaE bifunctional protein nucleotidyltransferase chain/domain
MIVTYSEFKKIREIHKNKKIVFCTGSFDLLHAGHVLFFEDCKKYGDILVVGIGDDSILKVKGENRPILNQTLRLKMLDSLKVVDYCFIHKNIDGPFLNQFIPEILEELHPDVWVINTDASEIEFRTKVAETYGLEFRVLDRTCPPEFEEISTSKIIKKIQGYR